MAIEEARLRLEADSVDILVRHKRELEEEVERLRGECERAAGSFKLAWQEERAAHQRDLESAAAARALAAEEVRKLSESLATAQRSLEEQREAHGREVAQLREALELGRRQLETARTEGHAQMRSLQRQLARVRAEKGELCEEFSTKLRQMQALPPQSGPPPQPMGAGFDSSVDGGTALGALEAMLGGSSRGGGEGGAAAVGANAYAGLSAFLDTSGAAAAQLQVALSSAVATEDPLAAGVAVSRTGGGAIVTVQHAAGVHGGGGGGSSSGAGSGSRVDPSTHAPKRAIEGMKLAQQLRSAEAELEKAQRLLATKARRVLELEQDAESSRMALQAKGSEMQTMEAEKQRLRSTLEQEEARTAALQDEVTRLQSRLDQRAGELSDLQREQMRLVAHVDTLELVRGGHGGSRGAIRDLRGDGGGDPSWRPPPHPTRLAQLQRGGLPQARGASAQAGVGDGAQGKGSRGSNATTAPAGHGSTTARSEASTVSDAEWPDELNMSRT